MAGNSSTDLADFSRPKRASEGDELDREGFHIALLTGFSVRLAGARGRLSGLEIGVSVSQNSTSVKSRGLWPESWSRRIG